MELFLIYLKGVCKFLQIKSSCQEWESRKQTAEECEKEFILNLTWLYIWCFRNLQYSSKTGNGLNDIGKKSKI